MSVFAFARASAASPDECRIDGDGYDQAGGGAEPQPQVEEQSTVAADPAAPAADDDPDIDDDTFEDLPPSVREHPRFKRLQNQHRRLQRWRAANRTTVDRVRQLGDLDAVHQRAQAFDHIAAMAQGDPERAVQALIQYTGGRRPARPGAQSGPAAQPQSRGRRPFDEESFPFDRSAPGADYMLEQARALHEAREEIAELRAGYSGMTQERQQEALRQENYQWKTAVDQASKNIPESYQGLPIRALFRDAVYGAQMVARQRGIRFRPQDALSHYLQKFTGMGQQQAQRTAAAATQRMAEGNRNLPTRQSLSSAGGVPAPARDRSRETIYDVNKRILRRSG